MKFRVYTGDLDLLIESWRKPTGDPDFTPCADLDHKLEKPSNYRVGINDLRILLGNWKKKDSDLPGNCPRSPIVTNPTHR